jgi:hypothetical protein
MKKKKKSIFLNNYEFGDFTNLMNTYENENISFLKNLHFPLFLKPNKEGNEKIYKNDTFHENVLNKKEFPKMNDGDFINEKNDIESYNEKSPSIENNEVDLFNSNKYLKENNIFTRHINNNSSNNNDLDSYNDDESNNEKNDTIKIKSETIVGNEDSHDENNDLESYNEIEHFNDKNSQIKYLENEDSNDENNDLENFNETDPFNKNNEDCLNEKNDMDSYNEKNESNFINDSLKKKLQENIQNLINYYNIEKIETSNLIEKSKKFYISMIKYDLNSKKRVPFASKKTLLYLRRNFNFKNKKSTKKRLLKNFI